MTLNRDDVSSKQIVADELRKNIGFRLLISLAYPQRDYQKALHEAAEVFAECVVGALEKSSRKK